MDFQYIVWEGLFSFYWAKGDTLPDYPARASSAVILCSCVDCCSVAVLWFLFCFVFCCCFFLFSFFLFFFFCILFIANSVDPDETAHDEPSHLDLRCLTFNLLTLHINFFPSDSLLEKKR